MNFSPENNSGDVERWEIEMKYQKITKETLLEDEEFLAYLRKAQINAGKRGGTFVGNYDIASEEFKKYGIVLSRGGMILPEIENDVLKDVLENMEEQERKDEEDRELKIAKNRENVMIKNRKVWIESAGQILEKYKAEGYVFHIEDPDEYESDAEKHVQLYNSNNVLVKTFGSISFWNKYAKELYFFLETEKKVNAVRNKWLDKVVELSSQVVEYNDGVRKLVFDDGREDSGIVSHEFRFNDIVYVWTEKNVQNFVSAAENMIAKAERKNDILSQIEQESIIGSWDNGDREILTNMVFDNTFYYHDEVSWSVSGHAMRSGSGGVTTKDFFGRYILDSKLKLVRKGTIYEPVHHNNKEIDLNFLKKNVPKFDRKFVMLDSVLEETRKRTPESFNPKDYNGDRDLWDIARLVQEEERWDKDFILPDMENEKIEIEPRTSEVSVVEKQRRKEALSMLKSSSLDSVPEDKLASLLDKFK